jgi:hypothetical protein
MHDLCGEVPKGDRASMVHELKLKPLVTKLAKDGRDAVRRG